MKFPGNKNEETYINQITFQESEQIKWVGDNKNIYTKVIAKAVITKLTQKLNQLKDSPEAIRDLQTKLQQEFGSTTTEEQIKLLTLSASFGDLFYYKTADEDSAKRAVLAFNAANPDLDLAFPQENKEAFLALQKTILEICAKEIFQANGLWEEQAASAAQAANFAPFPGSKRPTNSPQPEEPPAKLARTDERQASAS